MTPILAKVLPFSQPERALSLKECSTLVRVFASGPTPGMLLMSCEGKRKEKAIAMG